MAVFSIVLFFLCAMVLLLAMAKRKQYATLTETLTVSDYNMLPLMPVGFWIQEQLAKTKRYKPGQTKNVALRRKVSSLYGERYTSFYLMIVQAHALTSAFVVVMLFALLGIAMENDLLAVLGIPLAFLVYRNGEQKPDQLLKERQRALQLEFPDFMSKIVLLLGANMPISKAWRVAAEGEKHTALSRELAIVTDELELGTPEADALNNFARRCRSTEVSRFVSAVVQNIEQGGENLAVILDTQVNENWLARKQTALRLGQEASTKLVFPMVLMFLGVMIVVLAPALMSLGAGF